jgi:hypothetical protein
MVDFTSGAFSVRKVVSTDDDGELVDTSLVRGKDLSPSTGGREKTAKFYRGLAKARL